MMQCDIDKSRGQGCITCKVEKGKTCKRCIHNLDAENTAKQKIAGDS